MEPWLNRNDFLELIGEIPSSFDTLRLAPTLKEVLDGWLLGTIGAERRTLYTSYVTTHNLLIRGTTAIVTGTVYTPAFTESNRLTTRTMREFLVYAVWSSWLLKYGMTYTATGPVIKLMTESDPISDRQRSDLHRYYRGLAENKAAELVGMLDTNTACIARSSYSTGPRVRAVRPVSPSRLEN